MIDALTALTGSALRTATATDNNTAIDLKTGTPRRGMYAQFIVTNYSCSSVGAIVTFSIDSSDDNTTFNALTSHTPLTLATAAGTTEFWVNFDTAKRYVRASATFNLTTGTPTITYRADVSTGENRQHTAP